jgi:hypothetical protein
MSTTATVVTLVAAAMVGFSAVSVFLRAKWVMEPFQEYGVPLSWLPWLGTAKALGAAGLVVGVFVPVIAVMAAIGLVLYFTGAVITVLRAHSYSHIPFPLLYVAPVIGSLTLVLAA